MSLDIRCDCCNNVITEQGGLLFGPPDSGRSEKFHICKECYPRFINLIGKIAMDAYHAYHASKDKDFDTGNDHIILKVPEGKECTNCMFLELSSDNMQARCLLFGSTIRDRSDKLDEPITKYDRCLKASGVI